MGSKNIKLRAFSLAETLITIGILAVIAALVTPTLGLFKPNKTKAMFTKTYQITERIIYEMVNDPLLYPDNGLLGFDNVAKVSFNGIDYQGNTKFAGLFASKLNTLSNGYNAINTFENTWEDESELTNDNISIVTTDGVFWALPLTNFTAGDTQQLAYKKIYIDVNGNKAPNIMDSENDDATCSQNVDRFTLYVRTDGQVRVKGACAREYLNEANMLDSEAHDSLSNSDLIEVVADGQNHDSNTVNDDATDFDGETGNFNPADEGEDNP